MAPGGEKKLFRAGIDIGGTFTDLVFLDEGGRLHTKKVSSSVDDYARAIIDGLGEVFRDTGITGADIAEVLHGTTVASNAVLEQKGRRRWSSATSAARSPSASTPTAGWRRRSIPARSSRRSSASNGRASRRSPSA
jgi:hypothetical protein